MRTDLDLSVILPVFNNALTLRQLVEGLHFFCGKITSDFELIFVDDGSTDDSLRVLQGLVKDYPEMTIVALTRNFGQHSAISAGFDWARGEILVLMDADLQESPGVIPELVRCLSETGSEIVFTTRKTVTGEARQRHTSAAYFWVFEKFAKTQVPRSVGTQRAFTKKVLMDLQRYGEANPLYGPLMHYMGHQYHVIEVPHADRPSGKSGYTLAKRLSIAANSLISFSSFPHKVALGFGVLVSLGSLLYATVVVLQVIFFSTSLPGGTTLIVTLIAFLGGTLSAMIGMIGIYVFRVYQEVLQRPRYLVRQVTSGQTIGKPDESGA